jgi:hypothetical protein
MAAHIVRVPIALSLIAERRDAGSNERQAIDTGQA